jgi:hypothetical protein
MSIVEFAFAFFVFILVCLAILLYARVVRPAKQKGDTGVEKEKRLFKLYQNLEDMMNGIEEYVEEARKEIAQDREKINGLLLEAVRIQKEALVQEQKPREEVPSKEAVPPVPVEEPPAAKLPRGIRKNEMVLTMKKEGMDDDKIAKELGISRGEVALILGINK